MIRFLVGLSQSVRRAALIISRDAVAVYGQTVSLMALKDRAN